MFDPFAPSPYARQPITTTIVPRCWLCSDTGWITTVRDRFTTVYRTCECRIIRTETITYPISEARCA